MLKKYEKPVLAALSLSGNENLCGSCGARISEQPGFAQLFQMMTDQAPTREQVEKYFGLDECNDGIHIPKDFMGFCKFTPSGGKMQVAFS